MMSHLLRSLFRCGGRGSLGRAHVLQDAHLGAVALADPELDDARIAALAVLHGRGDLREELLHGLRVEKARRGKK